MSGRAPEGVFGLEDGVRDQFAGMLIFQTVENTRALLARGDDAGKAQFGQVLRDGRRGFPNRLGKLIDRHFPRLQGQDNSNPGGIGEHGKHLNGQLNVLGVWLGVLDLPSRYLLICAHMQILPQNRLFCKPARLSPERT